MLSRDLVSRRYLRALLVGLCAMAGILLLTGAATQAAITHPYTGTSFGPEGMGTSFGNVVGVTVDQTSRDVFVLDASEGGRVYKFNAAGEPVDFSGSGTNFIENAGSSGGSEEEIAVDSSAGPDAGDIYVANNQVVEIYAASGAFLGELSGGEMCGVAVDPSGGVYVGIYPGTVRRYMPASNPVTNANTNELESMSGLAEVCNVAVDASGDVYAARFSGDVTKYDALQFGSSSATGEHVDALGRTLAVDPTSSEVLVDETDQIMQYEGSSEPPKRVGVSGASGAGALAGSFGVGVDHVSGEVYAGDGETVEIFGPGVAVASASTEGATGVTGAEATLHGTVEPAGTEIASCVFEYGTEAGTLNKSAPCKPATPYTGNAPVAVSAHLTGLSVGTSYRYRILAAGTSGSLSGSEESFTTKGPDVSDESFSNVGSNTAGPSADISPNGEPTSYEVEYGTSIAYGSNTPPVSVGAGEASVHIEAHLAELTPGTSYHFRFIAINGGGTVVGPDLVFTTHELVATGLPDGRGYEMVTPAANQGAEAYAPFGTAATGEEDTLWSRYVSIAAEDGEALAYTGAPTSTGNGSQGNGEGNQFLARRNPGGGWTQTNIQPTGYASPIYWAFSKNLEAGLLVSSEALTGEAPAGYANLYVRNNESGSYHPLSTVTPPNRPADEFGAANASGGVDELGEHFAGASADFTHVLFTANDTLAAGTVDPGLEENNLYESVGGALQAVNVLPDGSAAPNASFGSAEFQDHEAKDNFSRVISSDGARVFWTDKSNGSLYVRENGIKTSLVAEGATYLTASMDGSKVLYTKAGDMFEDDLETGETHDLALGGQVQGLVGASENLEFIYLVAEANLAGGATLGQSNLYLLHGGVTTFIATLGSTEEEEAEFLGFNVYPWEPDIGWRDAQVTPSGQDLVFMSKRSLTGYDNVGREGVAFEVYVFDATSGRLSCVSCDPTGEPPTVRVGGLIAISAHPSYQEHVISDDGDRVFFESDQPLLPQAKSGELDVYEWERDGSGTCAYSSGCIYLLSNPASSTSSFFIDASASGDDVFLVTRSQLVPSDKNEYNDIYDARVGAEGHAVPTQCTGTGCQGAPPAPPVFATPASTTFNGIGNFPYVVNSANKPKPNPKKKTSACAAKKQKKRKKAKAKPVRCKVERSAKRTRHQNKGGGR